MGRIFFNERIAKNVHNGRSGAKMYRKNAKQVSSRYKLQPLCMSKLAESLRHVTVLWFDDWPTHSNYLSRTQKLSLIGFI